ncbi:MAG: hypothetical protein ABSE63_06655 [Thermoguttaceae bacterium]
MGISREMMYIYHLTVADKVCFRLRKRRELALTLMGSEWRQCDWSGLIAEIIIRVS